MFGADQVIYLTDYRAACTEETQLIDDILRVNTGHPLEVAGISLDQILKAALHLRQIFQDGAFILIRYSAEQPIGCIIEDISNVGKRAAPRIHGDPFLGSPPHPRSPYLIVL